MGCDRDLRHIRGIDLGVIVGNADSHPQCEGQRPVYMLRVSLLGSTMATLEFFIAATVRRFLQRR
jgi:hypothetical protein